MEGDVSGPEPGYGDRHGPLPEQSGSIGPIAHATGTVRERESLAKEPRFPQVSVA